MQQSYERPGPDRKRPTKASKGPLEASLQEEAARLQEHALHTKPLEEKADLQKSISALDSAIDALEQVSSRGEA